MIEQEDDENMDLRELISEQKNQISALRAQNSELAVALQHAKITAAQIQTENLDLKQKLNEMRLQVIKLRCSGDTGLRRLDDGLQIAASEALSHMVQASGAVERSLQLAKEYIRQREELDSSSPHCNSLSGSPKPGNAEKVNRVPPLLIGGQSIQPVVSLSRTMINSAMRSREDVRERAVPIHMLQDLYVPLTRVNMANLHPGNHSMEEDDLGMQENDEPIEESDTSDDFEMRRLESVAEEVLIPSDVDLESTPPSAIRAIDNPLEGPSSLLDVLQERPNPGSNLEPDSTTPSLSTAAPPAPPATPPAAAPCDEVEKGNAPLEQHNAFTPTVRRRRKRAASPPASAPLDNRIPRVVLTKIQVSRETTNGEWDASPHTRAQSPILTAPLPSETAQTITPPLQQEYLRQLYLCTNDPSPHTRAQSPILMSPSERMETVVSRKRANMPSRQKTIVDPSLHTRAQAASNALQSSSSRAQSPTLMEQSPSEMIDTVVSHKRANIPSRRKPLVDPSPHTRAQADSKAPQSSSSRAQSPTPMEQSPTLMEQSPSEMIDTVVSYKRADIPSRRKPLVDPSPHTRAQADSKAPQSSSSRARSPTLMEQSSSEMIDTVVSHKRANIPSRRKPLVDPSPHTRAQADSKGPQSSSSRAQSPTLMEQSSSEMIDTVVSHKRANIPSRRKPLVDPSPHTRAQADSKAPQSSSSRPQSPILMEQSPSELIDSVVSRKRANIPSRRKSIFDPSPHTKAQGDSKAPQSSSSRAQSPTLMEQSSSEMIDTVISHKRANIPSRRKPLVDPSPHTRAQADSKAPQSSSSRPQSPILMEQSPSELIDSVVSRKRANIPSRRKSIFDPSPHTRAQADSKAPQSSSRAQSPILMEQSPSESAQAVVPRKRANIPSRRKSCFISSPQTNDQSSFMRAQSPTQGTAPSRRAVSKVRRRKSTIDPSPIRSSQSPSGVEQPTSSRAQSPPEVPEVSLSSPEKDLIGFQEPLADGATDDAVSQSEVAPRSARRRERVKSKPTCGCCDSPSPLPPPQRRRSLAHRSCSPPGGAPQDPPPPSCDHRQLAPPAANHGVPHEGINCRVARSPHRDRDRYRDTPTTTSYDSDSDGSVWLPFQAPRTKRLRNKVAYKEKPLNRKLRR